jgi:hypothetical protein
MGIEVGVTNREQPTDRSSYWAGFKLAQKQPEIPHGRITDSNTPGDCTAVNSLCLPNQ